MTQVIGNGIALFPVYWSKEFMKFDRGIAWLLILSVSTYGRPSLAFSQTVASPSTAAGGNTTGSGPLVGEQSVPQPVFLDDMFKQLSTWVPQIDHSVQIGQGLSPKGNIELLYADFAPGETDSTHAHEEIIRKDGTTAWVYLHLENGKYVLNGPPIVLNQAGNAVSNPGPGGTPSNGSPMPDPATSLPVPVQASSSSVPPQVPLSFPPTAAATAPATAPATASAVPVTATAPATASAGSVTAAPSAEGPALAPVSQQQPGSPVAPPAPPAPVASAGDSSPKIVAPVVGPPAAPIAPPPTSAQAPSQAPAAVAATTASTDPSSTLSNTPPPSQQGSTASTNPSQTQAKTDNAGVVSKDLPAGPRAPASNTADSTPPPSAIPADTRPPCDLGTACNAKPPGFNPSNGSDTVPQANFSDITNEVGPWFTRNPNNSCNQFVKWIHSSRQNEKELRAYYKTLIEQNAQPMSPWLKGSLEIGGGIAAGALVGLVVGPIGALIGAAGGAIGATIGFLTCLFGHKHHSSDDDSVSSRRVESQKRQQIREYARNRISCINSHLENDDIADTSQDARYPSGYEDAYQQGLLDGAAGVVGGRYANSPSSSGYPSGRMPSNASDCH